MASGPTSARGRTTNARAGLRVRAARVMMLRRRASGARPSRIATVRRAS